MTSAPVSSAVTSARLAPVANPPHPLSVVFDCRLCHTSKALEFDYVDYDALQFMGVSSCCYCGNMVCDACIGIDSSGDPRCIECVGL